MLTDLLSLETHMVFHVNILYRPTSDIKSFFN